VTYRRGRLGEVGVPDLQLCHRDHQDWGDAMEGAGLYPKAGMQDAPPAFRNMALRGSALSGTAFPVRPVLRLPLKSMMFGSVQTPVMYPFLITNHQLRRVTDGKQS
jgi:hypothetical protein